MELLRLVSKTIRLCLIRVGAGWMFALLTFNFNRTTIADLGAIAVIVSSLIGLHHFLSPLQVFWGRIADRHPILGYRRSPYILGSALIASLVFLRLPTVAVGLGEHSLSATLEALALITIFGIAMAANGSCSNALTADVTTDKERGGIVAFVWATIILSGIISAVVAGSIMPVYDPLKMQQLYNLTPLIVLVTCVPGLAWMERRVTRAEQQALLAAQPAEASQGPTFRVAAEVMRTNPHARMFFIFVCLEITGVFLQDAILEPFGAEVFGLIQRETSRFQMTWGSGTLLAMLVIGILTTWLPVSKKTIALIGGLSVAGGLGLIATSAALKQLSLIQPGLLLMGGGLGLLNVGAVSLMMEMTMPGQVGFYMGLWGMAHGLGNGVANIGSGALHTGLIETGLLTPQVAYSLIFGFEALVMVAAVGVLRTINVREFKGLSRGDIGHTLALDTVG